jgi:trafficking protein particle complex subunit 11
MKSLGRGNVFHPLSTMDIRRPSRRILPDGGYGTLTTSRFPLPPLKPPTDGLIALLDVPTQARLHIPIQMRLRIRNSRSTRAANVVIQVDIDPSDGFVLAGLRSGRVPILLPGGEEVLTWNMIPIECGYVRVPRMKVTDRRTPTVSGADVQADGDGEVVSVVDVRWDGRAEDGQERLRNTGKDGKNAGFSDSVVLVLP